jgi:hypothetical protein
LSESPEALDVPVEQHFRVDLVERFSVHGGGLSRLLQKKKVEWTMAVMTVAIT